MSDQDKYKQEVIDPGDRASQLAKEVCFQSHRNCPAVIIVPHQPDNFRGPVGFAWQKHVLEQLMQYETDPTGGAITVWTMLQEVENDGAGGKPQFFTLIGDPEVFHGLGWEIITMTADDFARTGRFPAVMDNTIDAKRITDKSFPLFQAVIEGYGAALQQAGLVNITGEVAIMKHSVTAFCDVDPDSQLVMNWGASCIGLAHRDLLIDGSKIKAGMPVVGFFDPGYRCNGGTFFTNVVLAKFGPNVQTVMQSAEALAFVRELTIPSQSYARTVCRLVGWNPDGSIGTPMAEIAGIAHITGGGVWGKFGELLPEGVGANLHSMPVPADVLLEAQELSWDTDLRLTDYQAYGTLHGGCGMLLIVDKESVSRLIKEAGRDGIKAQVVGETTVSEESEIVIQSRFKEGGVLSSKGGE
jgi:phosphoribosylformylglycinamidine cyclo-ligase